MNEVERFFKINVLTVLIVCFLAAAVYGQETSTKPVADEMIGSSGISWVPRVNYSRLVLTISRPDGTVFSTTFESGKTPYVGLGSILGSSYSDGSYTYELRVIPIDVQKFRRESELTAAIGERLKNHKALIQSGYFFVRGGAIARPDEPEGSSREPVGTGSVAPDTSQEGLSGTADICYNDDLIVDGSLCVGFDCTCNYSFGFDTIVLRENNLRIFFDDTSTSGSFPRNDWRIIINDSANGGAEYFGVEDSTAGRRVFTLEAGAPAHSLYVDDGGRVGLGTSTPVVDAHIVSGNTPTLRLEQDGSSGFSPQTWDVAGNETNFFVRDATNGSQLPFKIKPGAPNNSLFVASDGDIGLGTTSPAFALELERNNANVGFLLDRKSSGTTAVSFKLNVTDTQSQIGTQTAHPVFFVTTNTTRMTVASGGNVAIGTNTNPAQLLEVGNGASGTNAYCNGTDWFPSSSREVKENIKSLAADDAITALTGLNPVTYNYKTDKEEGRVGFIAEDVPEIVAVNGRKYLNSMDIVAVLTKVVKEQQKLVQKQQKTISELNKRVSELEKDSQQ